MSPLLSIITVNRNNAEGLRKTVQSVVNQNCSNFEYLIIDGASTDGSSDMIKEFASNTEYGSKIAYWVSEPDTGIYNAMNKGIQRAKGTYVYMLNSGDWLEPDSITHIIQKLQTEKPDLLLFLLNFWDNHKKVKTEIRYPDILYHSAMCHQGFLYKKDFHAKHGLYDEIYKFAADYDFCTKAFYTSNINIGTLFTPVVNFSGGGVGESELSIKEFEKIQIKNGFKNPLSKLKQIIKYCTPYGIIHLYRNLKNR